MALLISAGLFAFFFFNVLMGALANASFLGDVGEMVLLFAASLVFVIGILRAEQRDKNKAST